MFVVCDASGLGIKDLVFTGQVETDMKPLSQPDKPVCLPIDQHVPGTLHVSFFVANERVGGKDLSHPLFAEPALQSVLSKRAVPARLLDVWKLRHVDL
jgi:hypothetical protein